MIFLDKEHVVSALSTFAYHRAARQINQLYDKQIRVKRYLDYDDSYYGADEILNEIEHLLYAISFEELDEEQREIYEEAVSGDDTYIHRYMSVPFYVGLYQSLARKPPLQNVAMQKLAKFKWGMNRLSFFNKLCIVPQTYE